MLFLIGDKMKTGILLKQFLLAFFALFIGCIISACGSGTSSSSGGGSSAPVELGVLSNGSTLYTSTSSFPISDAGTPANGVLSLSGGTLASYTISFGASVLQGTQKAHANTARLQNTDTNGILVAPSSCMMGTAGSGYPQECAYAVSASESTTVGTYLVPVMATDSNGVVQNLGSITVLVSGTVTAGSRSITSYSLNGTVGVITGTNIAVEVPSGTDVNSLVATYITTGASVAVGSVTQTNGTTPNNFTSPVTYTVTAANGLTKNYTVTVTVASVSAKSITAFSLKGVAGVITGTNIAVEVPYGTDVDELVATFTTTGEKVTVGTTQQTSGSSVNNFTSPVVYTVTAADGTTQDYTVTVTVASNSAKAITEFDLDGTAGVITGTSIAVEMPSGTAVDELIATFTTTGEGVSVGSTPQVSGQTANDFTNPVTYTVTAANGTTQDYTVTVTIEPSWVDVGAAGFSAGGAQYTSLAFNPSTNQPYVAYRDVANGNKVTVMKFDGTSWVDVGTAGFSAGEVQFISLAFNPSTNEPYVAYFDGGAPNLGRATVMKFDGTAWVNVGTAGFSAGAVQYTSLAFNPSTNEPYVACSVGGDSKVTVMKFDGTSWVNVGTAGFSAGVVNYTSLAFNESTNEPYVAYRDGANSNKATVMKFDGTAWVNVGTAGFSAGSAAFTSLEFNPSTNQPYVAYEDAANGRKSTVMMFNDTSWVNVGTAGFSAGVVNYTSLAFNESTNEPYVAYLDAVNGAKATVMKFNGSAWVDVGAAGFSGGAALYTSLAFNPSTNQPYVAYLDAVNGSKATVMKY